MKKKLFAIVALALIFALCLSACGGKQESIANEAPAEEAAPEAAAPETTEAAEEPVAAEEEAPAEEPEAAADDFSGVTASLTMGTGGEQGTYYAFGGVLGTVIGQQSGISINVVSTGGSKDNLVSMDGGLYQLATVQSDVMAYAYGGTNTFADSGALTSFRVVGGLYAETVQIVTTNPELTSVSDLKGKSVCVGDVGSGTYYNTIDILNAYDMTIDDITPVYQSFGDSTESVKDGKIDAAVITAGAPTTAVTELSTSKQVYLISIDDEHMQKLLDSCPYYAPLTISADTYDMAEDAVTVTVKATLVCSADLDEDVVYAITKIIFDGKDDITAMHAKGEELDFAFATEGIAVPFHAGAAKYFAEQGITVETAE